MTLTPDFHAHEDFLRDVRRRHIALMRLTVKTLAHILSRVSQTDAATLRDVPNADGKPGWTVLEVVCHLRDFNTFFHQRALMMLDEDYPTLPAYDHEALALEYAYNQQDLGMVLADLQAGRAAIVEFFKGLNDEQWALAGVHPERGHFTMTDAVMQVGLHESDHLEQITRILAGG